MKSLVTVLIALAVVSASGVALAGASGSDTRPAMVMGTVVKVDGANLVVKQMAGRGGEAKEVTLVTTDDTKVMLDAEAAKLADLKADMRVMVTLVAGTTDKAARVSATSKGLDGTVVKVDGTNVVVKTGRGDAAKEVTVATDDKTKVLLLQGMTGEAKAGTLADLKADVRVTVIPETGTATKILVRPAGGGRRGGRGTGGGGGN